MSVAYSRLSGKKRSLGGYTQLWLAEDHLLLVSNSRFSERYQRFLLGDIQAIAATDKPSGGAQLSVATIIILWTLLTLAVTSPFAKGFFLITGLGLLVAIAMDYLRGPRCVCVLQTAVSRTVLRPISRHSQALKFLARMRPVIETAQAAPQPPKPIPPPLSEDDRTQAGNVSFSPSPAVPSGIDKPLTLEANAEASVTESNSAPAQTLFGVTMNTATVPPALPARTFRLQWILFAALLLTSGVVWLALSRPAQVVTLLPTVLLAEFVLVVLILIQGRAEPFKPTYLIAMIAAVVLVFDITQVSGVATWFAFVNLMENAGAPVANPVLHKMWFSRESAILFAVGWRLAAGALGMAAWLFESATAETEMAQGNRSAESA